MTWKKCFILKVNYQWSTSLIINFFSSAFLPRNSNVLTATAEINTIYHKMDETVMLEWIIVKI
ncbi:hypothetical protein acsn021_02950 [Anaerocolumna cellulosilytica]|uniref:Uncharacterized protein n=1 Tax=Anaerocolumna cellulosilytica TaxID=433286 RepID=A0A6S6QSW1_9FIRM|nr:hypothetical protein acsn021_02950 [Anaerocolumna cellulosilytica]